MRRFFGNLILFAVVGAGFYFYRGSIIDGWGALYARYFSCARPIGYSIGSFDTRFGISKERFLKAINDARMKINLVFDYRQEATNKMRAIGLIVADDQASYDTLTAKYRMLKREFEVQQASYSTLVAGIEKRSAAHNEEVAEWNRKKGAPRDVYTRLNEETDSLKRGVERIRDIEGDLRKLQGDINALVTVINQVANNINVSADEFNRIGKSQGEEFTEGLYTSDQTGQRIDIYQFNELAKLTRVLAHEFGHALSLEHLDDPKAIMYRLNQGANTSLTASDISALKKHCGIE